MDRIQDKGASVAFQSLCIDRVRFAFAVLLVLFHAFSIEALPSFSFGDWPLTSALRRATGVFLGDLIVPVYFFISGYLFYYGAEWSKETCLRKLKSRIHTLLVPYLLWNAAAILLVIFKTLPLFDSLLSVPGTGINLSLRNLLSCFWMYDGALGAPAGSPEMYAYVSKSPYPIDTALWYVRDLTAVVLLTPPPAATAETRRMGFPCRHSLHICVFVDSWDTELARRPAAHGPDFLLLGGGYWESRGSCFPKHSWAICRFMSQATLSASA